MLIINLRTISFVASLSAAIQSVLWVLGYILYMIAFGCGYKLFSTDDSGYKSDPSFYFTLYFEGSSCMTSNSTDFLTWIRETRNYSPQLLVVLISTGLVLNIALLATSIYILLGLNNNDNVRLYISRIKYFSISMYAVSIWDCILVGFVCSDIAPLLNLKSYAGDGTFVWHEPSSSRYPRTGISYPDGQLGLPYMMEVATITIMLLSRFIVVWICNVMFSTYMILKKSGEKGSPPPHPHSPYPDMDKTSYNFWCQNGSGTPQEPELLFSKNNGLPRRIVPPPPPNESPRDEVPKRWQQYDGRRLDDNEFNHSWRTNSIQKENRFDKGNWSAAEMHIRSSLQKWRNPSIRGLNKESMNHQTPIESKAPMLEPKKPSLLVNLRNSFRRSPEEKPAAEIMKPPQTLPDEVFPNKLDGFNYTQGTDNPFNIKLRHISRPSISEDLNKKSPENSGSSGEELFYKVTTIDPDDLYEPGTHVPPIPKEPAPIYSSTSGSSENSGTISPPLPPPIKESNNHNVRPQISLDEALRTRGPLRPVKRPGIDTSC